MMEEDSHFKPTSESGYLQSDFQQDSDPFGRDIKDGVSEQADDSVHIEADTDVMSADDNDGEKLKDSPRTADDGEKLKDSPRTADNTDGEKLSSPRKDTSATEDVTISQDDISSSRKKSKKKKKKRKKDVKSDPDPNINGENLVTAKSENPEMRKDEVMTAIAPIDLQTKREEEQRIKMSWTNQLSVHNKVSPADDQTGTELNTMDYHPEKTLDLDKYGATVPVNGASSYNPGPRQKRKEIVIGGDPDESTGDIGCCGSILMAMSFFLVFVTLPFSLFFCIKVVQEYERAVIFRLGRLLSGGSKGPGIFFVLPCIESYTKVDLRTVSFDVPPQEILTSDSVTVAVDAVVYYRVCNPTISVANVENAHHATRLLAQTTLRNILGTKSMSQILTDRDSINKAMQSMLDEATIHWGIKVERVEIKDVRLPKQLQKAMAAEAEASREARAKVLAAEGEQNASRALKEAADIIQTSPAALQLRYLQTLNTIASEKNSTVVFPLPIDMLSSFLK